MVTTSSLHTFNSSPCPGLPSLHVTTLVDEWALGSQLKDSTLQQDGEESIERFGLALSNFLSLNPRMQNDQKCIVNPRTENMK
eukprot:scaffold24742_cov23-Cyclotella_meneghiniana.AAC.1